MLGPSDWLIVVREQSEQLRPSEDVGVEDGGSVEEGSPRYMRPDLGVVEHVINPFSLRRSSNTSKKRIKSRKKAQYFLNIFCLLLTRCTEGQGERSRRRVRA